MLARLVGCVAGVLVCTIVQELVHTEQVRRLGGEMRFACAYCRGYLAGGGYRTNPLEEEAGCVRRRTRTLTRWSLIGIQWSTVNMRLVIFRRVPTSGARLCHQRRAVDIMRLPER